MDVFIDLLRLLLIDEVSNSFHYNYFFQKWNVFLELPLIYIGLATYRIIGKVLVTHNELGRDCYLSSGPRRSEFPVSVT